MSDKYIHGYSETERQRLALMQTILNDAELRELDLSDVRSIIDVGAGLGQLTRALARKAGPDARVVGVEKDPRQLKEAVRVAEAADESGLVEFRVGDGENLRLSKEERGSFDLAHARFLLEHVRDPLAVVREMAAAVRPGGRVVLIDDDHELFHFWPPCPEAECVWRVYWESYRMHGYDPIVGRRLPELLHEAGVTPCRISSIFYGAVNGDPMFVPVVDNVIAVLEGANDDLVRSGSLDQQAMSAACQGLRRWSDKPFAAIWYSLPLAEGIRPGHR